MRSGRSVERALEVAEAKEHVAAVVECGSVARVLLEDRVELALCHVDDAVARVDDADLQARVEVLRIGGERLAVAHDLGRTS